MDWKFKEQFRDLLNEKVPRIFLKSQESRSGHLDESDYGVPLHESEECLPVPEDGFISRYCRE